MSAVSVANGLVASEGDKNWRIDTAKEWSGAAQQIEGLAVDGDFVISAKWTDGKATELSILSRSGGECRIAYSSIGKAIITDSSGNEVKVTRDGNDQIHFASAVGETYTFKTIK